MEKTSLTGDWTTRDIPAGVRVAAARDMLSRVHLPWELRLRDSAPYACNLAWTGLGGCTLIACNSSQLTGHRARREISHTEGDYVGLLLVLDGREQVRQGEVSANLKAGDMMLWDGTQPIDFEVLQPLRKITLLIPRERLEQAVPNGRIPGACQLDKQTGLGGLVAGHIAALGHLARDIPAGDAPFAADLVVDLLARMLAPAEAPRHHGGLTERILKLIEHQLDDPDLTPSLLADTLGVSPRYLHMAFSATGGTLAAHIRARRLDRVRRDLADPRLGHLSVTEIVFRWGFNDAAHASRVFRKAYGLPPSQFRARAGANLTH